MFNHLMFLLRFKPVKGTVGDKGATQFIGVVFSARPSSRAEGLLRVEAALAFNTIIVSGQSVRQAGRQAVLVSD